MKSSLKKGLSCLFIALVIVTNCFVAFAEKNDSIYGNELDITNIVDTYGYQEYLFKGYWSLEDGYWYYIVEGKLHTGWLDDNNSRYYMNENGIMQTGWRWVEDAWYYFDSNGAMRTGWLLDSDDKLYYLLEDGKMKTGWQWIKDAWYYFELSGAMKTGWLNEGGKTYYLLEDGKMSKEWVEVEGNKYYMNSSGAIQTDWQWIKDAWYYFESSGVMQTGWLLDSDDKLYYLLEDGKMKTGWQWIEDAWYYFNDDGSMVTGWLVDNGEKYYLLEDGKMNTGWLEFGENKYYMNSSGAMQTGFISIEGVWNQFSENGEFIGIGEPPSEYPLNGIDVSYWQGEDIDWNAVKASGIEFVMIRSNFGWTGVDKRFKQNIEGAKAAGLKVGVYLYSYATNVTEAGWEFDNLMRTISGYELDYPVAYDIEDPTAQGNLPVKELTDIAVTFCEKVKEAGYTPMVYGSVHWLENKLDYNRIKDYKIWVAQYNSVCQFDYDYNIWQYTSQGRVDGIDGNVDRNICYSL